MFTGWDVWDFIGWFVLVPMVALAFAALVLGCRLMWRKLRERDARLRAEQTAMVAGIVDSMRTEAERLNGPSRSAHAPTDASTPGGPTGEPASPPATH